MKMDSLTLSISLFLASIVTFILNFVGYRIQNLLWTVELTILVVISICFVLIGLLVFIFSRKTNKKNKCLYTSFFLWVVLVSASIVVSDKISNILLLAGVFITYVSLHKLIASAYSRK